MTRIAYFVHGRGRGHAARAVPCIAALRHAGHAVEVAAGGAALDLLGADVERHIRPVLPRADFPLRFAWRVAADLRWLRSRGARLVIVDGDAPGLHAAAVLGLRSIAIGRGLVSVYCRLHPSLPPRGRLVERFKSFSSAWLATRRVGVYFLPVVSRDARTRVARPDLPATADTVAFDTNRIVCYFRDGNGSAILRALAAAGHEVVCFGRHEQVPGVETRPFGGHAFQEAVHGSRAVVCSAGSNLLAEAIALHKPVLAFHHASDFEQAANAALVQRADLGLAATFDADATKVVRGFQRWLDGGGGPRLDLRSLMRPISPVVVDLVDELSSLRPRRS